MVHFSVASAAIIPGDCRVHFHKLLTDIVTLETSKKKQKETDVFTPFSKSY